MTCDQYELVDFGKGRKLESLAGYLIDRPSTAAEGFLPHHPQKWASAAARYDSSLRAWTFAQSWPGALGIDCGGFRMPVQPTPFGHIGLFPEQFENWSWLRSLKPGVAKGGSLDGANGIAKGGGQADTSRGARSGLNLFGYTGASTMALVSAGFQVAHVDAAKPNVHACRRAAEQNAELLGWGQPPIRYLVDDAAKFVAREVRRGRQYRAIVIDPPAYGHAPGGKAWRLERDLWPLLDQCLQLVGDDFALLVTGHSPQVDQADISEFLRRHKKLQARWRRSGLILGSGRSQLKDIEGRALDAGFFVRLVSGNHATALGDVSHGSGD